MYKFVCAYLISADSDIKHSSNNKSKTEENHNIDNNNRKSKGIYLEIT